MWYLNGLLNMHADSIGLCEYGSYFLFSYLVFTIAVSIGQKQKDGIENEERERKTMVQL